MPALSGVRGRVDRCMCAADLRVCRPSRRAFIGGAAAFGALAATAGVCVADPPSAPRRIDVHHHITPPSWLDAVRHASLDNPPMVDWSPQQSIGQMDKAGVATAVTSPTTPQVGFLPAADAARVARESNEYARRLASAHRGRFGVFAMLPMPHIDESLREIEYALDTLEADGIGMMTSYGDKWLGDPLFAPVFDELNRRRTTVYTHPTGANCCVNLVPGIPPTVVEYGADTTRTIASLIFTGMSQRCREINFIFSHGGGVLSAVAERFQIQIVSSPPYRGRFTRESVEHELKRFYYDTAQVANSVTIAALAQLVPTSQIVFGSDYPYRTPLEHVEGLAKAFGDSELAAIGRDNALRILPRLGPV